MEINTITCKDALSYLLGLPDNSVDCCITSPPYYAQRNYESDKQIGHELHPKVFVESLVCVFEQVRRVLKPSGTFWLNIGDTYAVERGGTAYAKESIGGKDNRGRGQQYQPNRAAKSIGYKHKDLMLIPYRLVIALQDAGWYVRSDIIWHKPNGVPESVKDRPTKSHEYVYLLTKSPKYYYDYEAIKEPLVPNSDVAYRNELRKNKEYDAKEPYKKNFPKSFDLTGKNRRTVWTIPTKPSKVKHSASFPEALIEPMVKAGCPVGGIVLDPFMGSGTTAAVAKKLGRNFIGCDTNPEYVAIATERVNNICLTN